MSIKDECTKSKICTIVRTYLIFKEKANTKELCDFINFNGFNMRQGINNQELPIIIKINKKRHGILKDIEIEKNKNGKIYYKLKKK